MRYVAVIEIGATAVRLSVMEFKSSESSRDWKILDHAESHSSMGQDIFETGKISRATQEEIIHHIKSFLDLCKTYAPEDILLLGSFAIGEAQNRELLQDRILMETGLEIRILGGMETNQLRYLALSKILNSPEMSLKENNSLIVDIGSSSTEVMYLENGNMTWADTLQLGVIRDRENLAQSPDHLGEELGQQIGLKIRRVLMQFASEYNLKDVHQIILMGREILSLAPFLGEKSPLGCYCITSKDYLDFLKELGKYNALELKKKYGLSYRRSAGVLPAMYIGASLLDLTSTRQLIIPTSSALDGIFVHYISSPRKIKNLFKAQIISSAWSLGRHYHIDENHASYVKEKALQIYQYICEKKKMEMGNPVLLETAAILHDMGGYISSRAHHKHGQYLVDNSTLFGLNARQKAIVAQVVRYHRKAKPTLSHRAYMDFPRETRVIIQQLAAVIRVADSLDRSHTQRIHFSLSTDGSRFIIHCQGNVDNNLEKSSLKMKADLFEEIYGLKVILN
ncbi:MAG: HD domain-containing protein [Spirochaetaceae bacterium]|jgi:exopolyphosphatase/guanosine-5'-triphosphate,3'-diphosphate pyrophosphatase|nr:HD domain-containing protein [Spirochaetaceae bacterium]